MDTPLSELLIAAIACVAVLCVPSETPAFCGFYVSDGSARLSNDATMVNLLRDGNRTVMTMRNAYRGPPEDFAMIVPVPEVLERSQVETLNPAVFERLDRLTAPRLVEYWKDPWCYHPHAEYDLDPPDRDVAGVEVASRFQRGEYEVTILEADESNALETWLTENDYNLPKGAARYLRPTVQQGQYFFVARVDADRVSFEETADGDRRAVLSPLRFHYETADFRLPIRLGLINADGPQDLVVTILSREGRYEVANRPNVTVPTNLRVAEQVQGQFGRFYDWLFSRTVGHAASAAKKADEEGPAGPPVVTEYAWGAGECDSCRQSPMSHFDLASLGGNVVRDGPSEAIDRSAWKPLPDPVKEARGPIVGIGGTAEVEREAIEAVVDKFWRRVQSCLQRDLGGEPPQRPGRVVVQFEYQANGDPSFRMPIDEVGGKVGLCSARVMLDDFPEKTLPQPDSGTVIVRVTIPISPWKFRALQLDPEEWTVTRLHSRYRPGRVTSDLVFRRAEPIRGGSVSPDGPRGVMGGQQAEPAADNRFQARYIILNDTERRPTCDHGAVIWWRSRSPDSDMLPRYPTVGSRVGAPTDTPATSGSSEGEETPTSAFEDLVREETIPFPAAESPE